jgi:hypothetical protein
MKKNNEHYVNNKEFSQSVMDYVIQCKEAREKGEEVPQCSRYIGECFLKIANRLSLKGNFRDYTYRDDMVGDAIENCLKAVQRYNIDASTRTGNPNAFAYFTQICYYAFLRRIAKEKKQQEIRENFIEHAGLEDVAYGDESNTGMLERMKKRNGVNRKSKCVEIEKTNKPTESGLEIFML